MRKVVIYDLFDNNSLGINKTIAHKTFKRLYNGFFVNLYIIPALNFISRIP